MNKEEKLKLVWDIVSEYLDIASKEDSHKTYLTKKIDMIANKININNSLRSRQEIEERFKELQQSLALINSIMAGVAELRCDIMFEKHRIKHLKISSEIELLKWVLKIE